METRWIDLRGTRAHATVWKPERGATATSSPILLVHGLGGSTVSWGPSARLLAGATGTQVVALDLPGFGRTRLRRGSAGIPAQQAVVKAAIGALGGRAIIVGNSMGGLVALNVALQHPELVDRLVLVAPALSAGRRSLRALRAAARFAPVLLPVVGPRYLDRRQRRLGAERHTDERLRAIVRDPDRVDPETRAAMIELSTLRTSHGEAGRAYSEAARSIFRVGPAAWRAVARVATPTLVVHGTDDELVPVALVARLRRQRPDWRYEIFDDCGHLPHLEQPDRFAETVARWLRDAGERHGSSE